MLLCSLLIVLHLRLRLVMIPVVYLRQISVIIIQIVKVLFIQLTIWCHRIALLVPSHCFTLWLFKDWEHVALLTRFRLDIKLIIVNIVGFVVVKDV